MGNSRFNPCEDTAEAAEEIYFLPVASVPAIRDGQNGDGHFHSHSNGKTQQHSGLDGKIQ